MDRRMDRQTDRQTKGQTNRLTDRQIDGSEKSLYGQQKLKTENGDRETKNTRFIYDNETLSNDLLKLTFLKFLVEAA